MTKDGWKPLGGPMRPTPKIEPWWFFGLLGHGPQVEFDQPHDVAELFDHITGDNKLSPHEYIRKRQHRQAFAEGRNRA